MSAPDHDASIDGGDMDCGSGLLLLIREAMVPLDAGQVLEVRSREISVQEDLPAWCRLVGHSMVAELPGEGRYRHYSIRKRGADDLAADVEQARDYRWRVRVKWNEGMRATAYARNHSFAVGQPASFDTEDAAPSAIEYLLASLAGCLAVGFQWRLSRQRIEVRNLEVSLKAGADDILVFLGMSDEGHPGLASVEGTLFVDADADQEDLEGIWEETVRRSPIAQTILRQGDLAIDLRSVR